jgi:hypothetical protein
MVVSASNRAYRQTARSLAREKMGGKKWLWSVVVGLTVTAARTFWLERHLELGLLIGASVGIAIEIARFAWYLLWVVPAELFSGQARAIATLEKRSDPTLALPRNVEILNIQNQDEVSVRRRLCGAIYPADNPLQVMVKSYRSGRWNVQGPVTVERSFWQVECQFGDDPGVPGGFYDVVAVYGSAITRPEIDQLPAGATKSNIVRVRRRP